MSIKRSHIIPASLLTITIFSGVVSSSNLVSATDNTDVVDEINITVPISCSLEGTGMNTHNANINNGTVNSSIGETTMKIYCNDTGGYAIYAIGYTDDTYGKNVLTSSTLGSTYDIATGTATSGNTSNWAMKLSTITSPTPAYPLVIQNSFDSFHAVPDDYTLVAKRTSGTDIGTGAEGSTLKSTYQVYVDAVQPAGTYTGQVKYTLVYPHNAAKPEIPVSIAEATYLQEANSCPADLSEEQIYTLKDSRDNQEYKVAKLKDGNCWLLDNLAIDLTNATVQQNLTSLTTNASDETLAYLKGINTRNPNTNPDGNMATSAVSSSWNNSYSDPLIITSSKNSVYSSDSLSEEAKTWKFGVYYNYCAASAGSYCYGNGAATAGNPQGDIQEDVCPKGWQIPSSSVNGYTNIESAGDYNQLFVSYASSLEGSYNDIYTNRNNYNNIRTHLRIPLSGINASSIGVLGTWWANNTKPDGYSTTELCTLESQPRISFSGCSSGRPTGKAIRCILKAN